MLEPVTTKYIGKDRTRCVPDESTFSRVVYVGDDTQNSPEYLSFLSRFIYFSEIGLSFHPNICPANNYLSKASVFIFHKQHEWFSFDRESCKIEIKLNTMK